MATVLVWYHYAAVSDSNGWPVPVVAEPSLNTNDEAESITTPGATNPAPNSTEFAVIETDAKVRYTVRKEGQAAPDATALTKFVDVGQNQIALRPGQTIHFIDG